MMKLLLKILLTLISLFYLECSASDGVNTPSFVNTTTGNFIGTVNSYTTVYKGIRYADASIDNRWKRAAIIEDTDLITNADKFGNICYQKVTSSYPLSNMSEDCLFLNIWQPNNASSKNKKSVIIFIHGGAFIEGSGSNPIYNGLNLSEFNEGELSSSIVISFNYRLGALGFLNIRKENGNYGLMDQKMAIEWVYENIENFGGDKNNITLMGQSAGAMSTGVHISDDSNISSYITNAIMQSPYMGMGFKDEKVAKEIALDIKNIFENNSSDIYTMNPKDIIILSMKSSTSFEFLVKYLYKIDFKSLFAFSPYIDGEVVKNDLIHSKTTVPLLVGNNKDESNFMFKPLTPKTITSFIEQLSTKYKLHISDLDGNRPLENFFTNVEFVCATNYFAKQKTQRTSTYLYYNEHRSSFNFWKGVKECEGKVCHSSELPYIFANWYQNDLSVVTPTEDDKIFSTNIMKVWKEFSQTSNIKTYKKYNEYDSVIDMNNTSPYFFLKEDALKQLCTEYSKSY